MLDAELLVPREWLRNKGINNRPPVRYRAEFEDGWMGYRLTTEPSQEPNLGISPLRRTLTKEMGEVRVDDLTIDLPSQLSPADELLMVRYRVSARQEGVGPHFIPLAEVERRDAQLKT